MTDPLFRKLIFFCDIHLGRSGASPAALQDSLDFLDWAVERGLSWGAETLIFGGDWHDTRHQLHVSTLDASLTGMEKLSQAFRRIFWLPGNHDLFFREKRDVASVAFARHIPHVTLVDDPVTLGDVTLLPWLVGDEAKLIPHLRSRYAFGHLELPGFKMNDAVVLPDAPHLPKPGQFSQEYVFSGHFHRRQSQKRGSTEIVYTGNTFPFDFSDAWDEDRGIMLLEWGGQPIFEAWPEQPLYRTAALSDLCEQPARFLRPKTTIRAVVDLPMHYQAAQELRDALRADYGLRKLDLLAPPPPSAAQQEFAGDVDFRSVDQMVLDGILSVESAGIDRDRLAAIYRALMAEPA